MKTRLSIEGRLKLADEFAPAFALWPWFSIGIRPCIAKGKMFYLVIGGRYVLDVLVWPRSRREGAGNGKSNITNVRKER